MEYASLGRASSRAPAPQMSMRRRSGAYSSRTSRREGQVQEGLDDSETEHTMDVRSSTTGHALPTVMLVRPRGESPPLPPLPTFALSNSPESPSLPSLPRYEGPEPHVSLKEEDLSPISLTPRPNEISPFSDPAADPSEQSTVLTKLKNSLVSFRDMSAKHIVSRSGSTASSIASSNSSAKAGSLRELSRPPVRVALSAADKFTQKWPRPRSLRHMPPGITGGRRTVALGRIGGWSEGEMKVALRDGQGLGMDWTAKWTPHKWCLLVSVTVVFALGLTGLICAILTWFAAYPAAPLLLITDSPAFVLLTFSSSLLLLASIAGITGTLLNSRPILAVYVLLLFPSFISFVSIGYITYKKSNFALDGKSSEAWNAWYSPGARTVLQGALGCCGWPNPLHGAAPSGTCYMRTPLPGCRGPLLRFERSVLPTIYGAVFALVPIHIANIFVGLLCANHVTYRFGKGIMPKRYRLHAGDLARIGASSVEQEKALAVSSFSTEVLLPEIACSTSTMAGLLREDRQSGEPGRRGPGIARRWAGEGVSSATSRLPGTLPF